MGANTTSDSAWRARVEVRDEMAELLAKYTPIQKEVRKLGAKLECHRQAFEKRVVELIEEARPYRVDVVQLAVWLGVPTTRLYRIVRKRDREHYGPLSS